MLRKWRGNLMNEHVEMTGEKRRVEMFTISGIWVFSEQKREMGMFGDGYLEAAELDEGGDI